MRVRRGVGGVGWWRVGWVGGGARTGRKKNKQTNKKKNTHTHKQNKTKKNNNTHTHTHTHTHTNTRTHLPVCLSACLSVCLYVCPPVRSPLCLCFCRFQNKNKKKQKQMKISRGVRFNDPECVPNPSPPLGTSDTLPPWPNGQGVGPLIRRLRARVPQGVQL